MSNSAAIVYAKTYKRLIAMIYDGTLALAVLMFAAAIPLFFSGGEAIKSANIFMSSYLLLVLFIFFAWFWTRSGQTLGMQAWRIKLVQKDQTLISWQQAALRFLLAIPAWSVMILAITLSIAADKITSDATLAMFGFMPGWAYLCIGAIWLLLDNIPGNLREKLSGTCVIQLPK